MCVAVLPAGLSGRKQGYQNSCPMMKCMCEPLLLFVPNTLSKPYAQSRPMRPIIGRNTRTPTPAERFMSKGLNFFMSFHALPPSAKARA